MNKINNDTEAIIFDLGGVILNIDLEKIKEGFELLGFEDLNESFKLFQHNHIFEKFEKGEISPQIFRNEIRKACPRAFSDRKFDEIWNTILINFPEENIKLLETLKNKYRIFLLSNTNEIHYKYYTEMLNKHFNIKKLDVLFEKAYYSHTSKMRKPNKEFYELVIKENDLIKEKTVFIDDFLENIEVAKEIGLQTIHLNGFKLSEIFSI
ncbi:MAG: HAD family phosphatase [Bacteroidales bacterium]|nr:HAD family phosphatase [Bacteroidales bacterium]